MSIIRHDRIVQDSRGPAFISDGEPPRLAGLELVFPPRPGLFMGRSRRAIRATYGASVMLDILSDTT